MGRTALIAVMIGLLTVGVATAFAEEPSMSDQEILKAWGVPVTGDHGTAPLAIVLKPGLTPLTDESLDEITGAGVGFTPQEVYIAVKPWVKYGFELLQYSVGWIPPFTRGLDRSDRLREGLSGKQ